MQVKAIIAGVVKYVESKVTKDGKPCLLVKVYQEDDKGNGWTVPVSVYNAAAIAKGGYEVGKEIMIENVDLKPWSGKSGVGLNVNVW